MSDSPTTANEGASAKGQTPDTPPGADADVATRVNWVPPKKHTWTWMVIAGLGFVAVASILVAWRIVPIGGGGAQTDNSYVQGRTTVIAPQVAGTITKVHVSDYALVKKGQLLVEIDPASYAAAAGRSKAQIAVAKASLANNAQAQSSAQARLAAQQASLGKAEADLAKTRADYRRARELVGDGSVSQADLEAARTAWEGARSALAQVQAQIRVAREDVASAKVDRERLAAELDAAKAGATSTQIELDRTRIYAPEDGELGRVTVHAGQLVSSGTQLFTLVPPETWIIANFKEAETAKVRVGQRAWFTVDALGGAKLHGTVTRIAPATAAEFSAASPSQATGNFVKIPQRIGVRIAVDPGQANASRLRPGMSVETRIDTASSAADAREQH